MHHNIHKLALEYFLRRGMHIKAEPPKETREAHSTPYYIWRTQGDSKVRSRHAERNGKVFSWENPPEGGHPGEDYNCRCWAEALIAGKTEYTEQNTTSIIDEGLNRWAWYDFVAHFYFGRGAPLSLSQAGHLQQVINHTNVVMFPNFMGQLADEARKSGAGSLSYYTFNGYDFDEISYIHGRARIYANFEGNVERIGEQLHITGVIKYQFLDTFTDPLDIRQIGTNLPKDPEEFLQRIANMSDYTLAELSKLYEDEPKNKVQDLRSWIYRNSEAEGTAFVIQDSWSTRIESYVSIDRLRSLYFDRKKP